MNAAFHIDNPRPVTFEVERETRTIRGLALPYGDVGTSSRGDKWAFAKGTLAWDRVKVLVGHDWSKAIGTATFEDTDEGLVTIMKIARGEEGDRYLSLAEDGVYDGLSVGLGNDLQADARQGVNYAKSGSIPEVSLTPLPGFDRARVTSVAASAVPTPGGNMSTATTEETTEVVAFSADEGKALSEQVETFGKQLQELRDMKAPVTTSGITVNEEPIYRFAGTEGAPSGFDFATDMLAAANGDQAALKRIQEFTAEEVANSGPTFVATTDVNEVNPSQYRPDMFIGQAPTPTSPLFDTFRKGSIADVTPFYWTKLDRANTDVSVHDHTEDVDPSDDNLVTATGATVTPVPVSGKVHITREVADQGGNPNVSALVKAEFDRSYKIALETKTAALVAASAGSISALTGAIAAGANGAVAGAAIEAGLIDLQFIADGGRFSKFFGHVDLYKALASYENSDGEKRYPIINPQNRSGISGSKFAFLEIAGYRMEPTYSLGATSGSASLSYLADPNAVHVWNSGLTQLDKLSQTVAGWDIGVFGYFAGVVYDVTGLRKVSYDPTA